MAKKPSRGRSQWDFPGEKTAEKKLMKGKPLPKEKSKADAKLDTKIPIPKGSKRRPG